MIGQDEIDNYSNDCIIYLASKDKDEETLFSHVLNSCNINSGLTLPIFNTLTRHWKVIDSRDLIRDSYVKLNDSGFMLFQQLSEDYFKEHGIPLNVKTISPPIYETCEIIFQKHLEESPVIWSRETFKPSPKNLFAARDKMIQEQIIFKTSASVIATIISHEYENAKSYKEALEIRKELNKPMATTHIETHGPNSPAMAGGAGSTQTTTINAEPKAAEKKKWWKQFFDWIWEQIKKPLIAALSTGIIGFLSGLKVGLSHTLPENPTQSQLPNQQIGKDTSSNKNTILLDSIQRNK